MCSFLMLLYTLHQMVSENLQIKNMLKKIIVWQNGMAVMFIILALTKGISLLRKLNEMLQAKGISVLLLTKSIRIDILFLNVCSRVKIRNI